MEKLVVDRKMIDALIEYYNTILDETEDPLERMRAMCYLRALNFIIKKCVKRA